MTLPFAPEIPPEPKLATDRMPMMMTLLAMIGAVFIAYLVIGIAMPVVPLHVHQRLGFSPFVVGIVAGSQFAAALLSRLWAGFQADLRGGKRGVVIGLSAGAVSGLLHLLSLQFVAAPITSLSVLIIARVLLGAAESFIIMGVFAWGLPLAGPRNTGRMMSWVGVAIYVAYAIGAPIGMKLFGLFGFVSVALATFVLPLLSMAVVAPFAPTAPGGRPASFSQVLRPVLLPGLGLGLTAVGFGAISIFTTLLFARNGWENAWIALSAVSIFFVLPRFFLGHLPDLIGGPKVAICCALAEATGLTLLGFAATPNVAFIGAAIAGLGYSLIYPSFGVEALRFTPPQNRGVALGAYTAFLDLALGVASPLLGLLATRAGFQSVYLVSALIVAGAALVALFLLQTSAPPPHRLPVSPSQPEVRQP